uniref:Uncharacterized protein n=1 Tax=Anopheles gambiae TaxID=7165 RepID=A0A1S4GAM3_ANOGA
MFLLGRRLLTGPRGAAVGATVGLLGTAMVAINLLSSPAGIAHFGVPVQPVRRSGAGYERRDQAVRCRPRRQVRPVCEGGRERGRCAPRCGSI